MCVRNGKLKGRSKQRCMRILSGVFLCLGVAHAQQDLATDVAELISNGYMPDAVYQDQLSYGHAIYAIVEAAADHDPDRESEFRYLAEILLGGALPRTACGGNYHPDDGWKTLAVEELEENTIAEVARLYFDEGVQLTRLLGNGSHGNFPVSELGDLISQSDQWYEILPVRDHPLQDAVFVNLYLETGEISVDGNMGKVSEAIAQGKETMPVVFHYYPPNVLPVGAIESDNVGLEIIDMFQADSTRVSPPPTWPSGDFTAMMNIEDLEDRFDIPDKDEVDDDLWQAIEADLRANGFTFPIIIVMAAGQGDLNLYNSAERISVARELGESVVPTAFFYEPDYENDVNSYCYRLVRGEQELAEFGNPRNSGNPGGPPPPEPPVIPPDPPPKSD